MNTVNLTPQNWLRAAGALLLLAAVFLNVSSIGWLLTADQSIDSATVRRLIMAGQFALAAAGIALLVRPVLFPWLAGLHVLVAGIAGVLAVIGMIAGLGTRVAPPLDTRYWTYPEFECSADDAFCNRAAEAGLRDVMRYGKGAAFADIDGDGFVDLFAADAEPRLRDDWGVSSVYLNNGDGSFRPVDIGLRSEDLKSNWTGSFADMDNDGDQDLALVSGGYAGTGRLSLYENRMQDEGVFVPVTLEAGLEAENTSEFRWWGVAWADYDGDGYLDLAVSRVYAPALLFHNEGDGTFTNVTERMGVKTTRARDRDGKNIVWFDYDNDGDLDLYLAGIHAHNLFENLEGKYLLDVTERVFTGLIPENWIYEKGSPVIFAAAAADFDQDGREDLYLGRQVEQELVLYNQGGGSFRAAGTEVGVDTALIAKNSSKPNFENTMGLGVGDLQDDGWPDVIIGSGDPVRAADDVVFCNRGGVFERCTELLRGNADGPFMTRTHGIAFADVNRDGRTDVFQNLGGHAPWDQKSGIDSREESALFVANDEPGGNTAAVMLEGTRSNRDAIGARVRVDADRTYHYTVRSTQAFQSQNARELLIALGDSDAADLEITWPGGAVSSASVAAGDRITLVEPASGD